MFPRPGSVFDLVSALSEAIDMVSPLVADHHRRTAWFSVRLAEEMGLDPPQIHSILMAALIHDIGAFSLQERIDSLRFEFEHPERHAIQGFRLLDGFEPLQAEAEIIRHHHQLWKPPSGRGRRRKAAPTGSYVIHLADRLAILIDDGPDVVAQSSRALKTVSARSGTMFMPEAVEALSRLASQDELWLGAFGTDLVERLCLELRPYSHRLRFEDLEGMARVFTRIIDYRSHFTSTHSTGVAAVAEALAGYLGFSEDNRRTIRVAGYLHDLGKLAIPAEILEKPGHLEAAEYRNVQNHALYTRKLLERVPDLGLGIQWAAQHHERNDGSGYPEHSAGREVAFGSRVVAMADVLTALTEDRPYRAGMPHYKALGVLAGMTVAGRLDLEVFRAASCNFEELNECRQAAQETAQEDYESRIGEEGPDFFHRDRGAAREVCLN